MEIYINDTLHSFEQELSILEACQQAHVPVPTLCHHPDIAPQGVCGICVVEVDGEQVKACETPIQDQMNIFTHTDALVAERRNILETLLETHPNDCLVCEKGNGSCDLQNLCYEYKVQNKSLPSDPSQETCRVTETTWSMVRDMDKCILCQTCVAICRDVQKMDIYEIIEPPSGSKQVGVKGGGSLEDSGCISCGQCLKACPVGALYENKQVLSLNRMLKDDPRHFIVQTAPAVKHALGEVFGIETGTDVGAKLATAFRRLGFDGVFTTDFSADVTIMEEGTELIQRITQKGTLPMMTSCCPGWVSYVEKHCPDLMAHLSTCKSPQQMFGALSKTYYPELNTLDPKEVFTVSIMPCTAKKYEAGRKELEVNGLRDVDMVLTIRELVQLLKMNQINLPDLQESDNDAFLGHGTGAARIFASTGGVMEAALRTVYPTLTGQELGEVEFCRVPDLEGVVSADIDMDGRQVKVAVVNGIGNVGPIVQMIKDGTCPYTFIEVMACPGGCVNGGGTPLSPKKKTVEKRTCGLRNFDVNASVRLSHKNMEVRKLYEDYLTSPCGHKSHDLLHTHYSDKHPA